jgi:hypothetical protein
METGFVIALRLSVGLFGALALITACWGKEFRWGRTGKGPLMRHQWLGRLLTGIIGLFLIVVAVLLKVAPNQ